MNDLFFDVVDGRLIGSKRSVRLAHSKIREFTSERILSCYENYLHLQISLNSIELASYLIDSGLCFDAIDFLNVRAKILLGGRGVYEKVIDGNYEFLSDVRYSADKGFGDYTDPKIRDALGVFLYSACAGFVFRGMASSSKKWYKILRHFDGHVVRDINFYLIVFALLMMIRAKSGLP